MIGLLYSTHIRTDGSESKYPLRIIEDTELKQMVLHLVNDTIRSSGDRNPLYRNFKFAYLSIPAEVDDEGNIK